MSSINTVKPIPVREFRRSLRALEREIGLSLVSQTECCGVTQAQCHTILELDARGSSSIGELAEALELDASTMSRTADSLVRSGLVSRVDDPSNRRRQILDLSPAGKKKAEHINSVCDRYYLPVLDGAGKDRGRAMAATLEYLAAAIRSRRLEGLGCEDQAETRSEE